MEDSEDKKSFYEFIECHKNDDPGRLRLKWHAKGASFDVEKAIVQIECRRKCRNKLSRFLSHDHFLFPTVVSSEQASHQAVAKFHALLGQGLSQEVGFPKTLFDMTAGLGIDALSFAEAGFEVTACELDPEKAKALTHNASVLGLDNLTVLTGDSTILIHEEGMYGIVFVDPARRGENNSRVYNFHDCQPDIIACGDNILHHCGLLMVKGSPLLDITSIPRDLPSVADIITVSVEGECKEVLAVCSASPRSIKYSGIDLTNDGEIISRLDYSESDKTGIIKYASSLSDARYLYEPNASLMKLAPWDILCGKYQELEKLAPDSHLFVSPHLYADFPGRVMKIEKEITKKDRKSLKGSPVCIVSRNYPVSADKLRKELGLKEGKNIFLYATRFGKNPLMLLCERFNQNL